MDGWSWKFGTNSRGGTSASGPRRDQKVEPPRVVARWNPTRFRVFPSVNLFTYQHYSMKKILFSALALSLGFLAACERKETTVVAPPAPAVEKKTETNNTTVIQPAAPTARPVEKKTETTTVITPGGSTTEKKTTEQPPKP